MLQKQRNNGYTRDCRIGWLVGLMLLILGWSVMPTASNAQTMQSDVPVEVLTKNSLAASEFKNENYAAALPYLRWLIDNAPTVYNSERIHRRAVTSYYSLADSTDDEALRSAYLDSALTILQTAPAVFERDSVQYNRIRWENEFGRFLQKYGGRFTDLDDEAVYHYRAAYDLDPENTDPYYARTIVKEYVRLDMTDEAVDFMEDVESRLPDDDDMVVWLDGIRDRILRSPEDRIGLLEDRLARDSSNVKAARELFTIYAQMKMSKEMEAMGEFLLRLDPTADTFVQVADLKAENGEFRTALDLYDQALDSLPADTLDELKRGIEFKMAVSNYELDRLESARSHALRALTYDPEFGDAYILIGDVLVKAVSRSAFERRDKAVYWLALDYYEKAAAVDPDVRETARQKVQQYRAYLPTDEEKFFAGWERGEDYAVDYVPYEWVGETTEVR